MLRIVCALVFLSPAGAAADTPEGFYALFNGKDLTGWSVVGGKSDVWAVEDGLLVNLREGGGWLMTEAEFADFELRLEYRLSKHANSGVALRSPPQGDPAYAGMEIQILDDPTYKGLRPSQHTGSIYDVVAASKQANKPAGEWNSMRIVCAGRKVSVEVNGEKLVDADLEDHKERADKHPGLKRTTGRVGLQSHGGRLEFRNVLVNTAAGGRR